MTLWYHNQVAHPERIVKSITLRLPADLFEATARLASEKRQSLNSLIVEQLRELSKAERDKSLKAAYDLLGDDPESSVEHTVPAQTEVVERHERGSAR